MHCYSKLHLKSVQFPILTRTEESNQTERRLFEVNTDFNGNTIKPELCKLLICHSSVLTPQDMYCFMSM